MFDGGVLTTRDLGSLVDALRQLDVRVSDHERVEQLEALERVKAAAAAAQARVTASFVESQAHVAERWLARAAECSAAGDFDGWRAARDQAARASIDDTSTGHATTGHATTGHASTGHASTGDVTTGHAITGDVTAGHVEGARGTRGLRQRRLLSGIGAQVGLARRESPSRGSQSVRLALRLVHEMPHTLAALEAGHISEWRATIIARETAELGPSERAMVDAEVSGGLGVPGDPVGSLGDRELARRVRAAAYHADPDSVLARSARAEGDRRVTLRPAPDTMAYVTALLPVAQAVSVHAALRVAAASALAAGDARSAGQVMADEVVTRVTGQERAQDVSVEVQLVMTDRALFAGDEVCAQLPGYGTVPAAWARRLLVGAGADPGRKGERTDGRAAVRSPSAESRDDGIRNSEAGDSGGAADVESQTVEGQDLAGVRRARVWLRRLYTDPTASDLVAMDSSRRTFDGGLRRFLIARDGGICRTPWCDAPIRHIDHVEDHADGGATSAENGQGLCVRCNHSKQQSGWRAVRAPSTRGRPGGHRVATTTPTGHRYESVAPPLILGHPPDPRSPLERRLEKLLAAG